ncbi:glycosaminoglycan xylosylkinase [Plakobranchus ocellatus]|uniref:Glycosaminoglycan xylosylkinase n=1 Tax=Plakobranchus ocellatus TaxID=259542 RepID=A0AAV4A193_9GAST|nr:glycosaminoglycan xylosylkinase [Plakobranchus ocellatus]
MDMQCRKLLEALMPRSFSRSLSGAILRAMHQGKITKADVGHKGTQLKLTLVLNDEQKVVFKPAWYPRDYIVEGPPYAGRDRHNAEVAVFHLGRILELRRSPLVVGRKVHLPTEILPVATERLKKTFFQKNDKPCFYGSCLYCKGPEDGVCAEAGGLLEGSLTLWMPEQFHLKLYRHPWGRTYQEGRLAKDWDAEGANKLHEVLPNLGEDLHRGGEGGGRKLEMAMCRLRVGHTWEKDETYCAKVKSVPSYSHGPRLLDIVDTAVLDFLVGNADRHHYERMLEGGSDAALIILDNAKSFGNPQHDEMSILAPLYQCCLIRASLWQRLLALQDGVLSRVLASVLEQDPIAPVLTQSHLEALDRRLEKVLHQVEECVDRVGIAAIVVDNGVSKSKTGGGLS